MKALSIRLTDAQAKELELVARTNDTSMNQTIRDALDAHIAARRADPEFQARLQRLLDANRAALERLAR